MSRCIALIQARMSSSRLPGKVLEPIGDVPSIVYMVHRAQRARLLDQVVVVTSTDPSDDLLTKTLASYAIPVFRGDLNDVLKRYAEAAVHYAADEYVRLTGDCPLIDPRVIDAVITLRRSAEADYASNIDPPTYPDGLDCECFLSGALQRASAKAKRMSEREHVTPWMRKPDSGLRRANLQAVADLSAVRLTIDYADDLNLVREIVKRLENKKNDYDLFDVLRVLEFSPHLRGINHHPRNEGLEASIKEDFTRA